MSSRIRNPRFPQKDIGEIYKIGEYFKNECVKPGKKINDRSSISVSAFSDKPALRIDIETTGKLEDRQQFVNSTGKYAGCGLREKLVEFENAVDSLYAQVYNPGLDLISVLMEKIEKNEPIIKQDTVLTHNGDTTHIHYENHIYIFTDGYLEYSLAQKHKNSQYYFGAAEIEKVRRCIGPGKSAEEVLNNDNSKCLPPHHTYKNKFINLHILETHERDKDPISLTYTYPKGLRDNEILEAVWRKWAMDSGFKSFEWRKY
jgi:hypothetical protein